MPIFVDPTRNLVTIEIKKKTVSDVNVLTKSGINIAGGTHKLSILSEKTSLANDLILKVSSYIKREG